MKSDSEDSLADSDSQACDSANTLDEQSDDCQEVCRPASPTQLLQDRLCTLGPLWVGTFQYPGASHGHMDMGGQSSRPNNGPSESRLSPLGPLRTRTSSLGIRCASHSEA